MTAQTYLQLCGDMHITTNVRFGYKPTHDCRHASALPSAVVLTAQNKVVLHSLMEASDVADSLAKLRVSFLYPYKGRRHNFTTKYTDL